MKSRIRPDCRMGVKMPFFLSPVGSAMSRLFSTHPKLERRLDQLAELSTQSGRPI